MGRIDQALVAHAPRFLIVSPPRTATTWMAANLAFHPGIFIPSGKELHYFNLFYRRFDINWYLSQFAAAAGRVAGEATPSTGLPLELIRAIHHFFPDVRLVFLLREPRAHAWSWLQHRIRAGWGDFGGARSPRDLSDRAIIGHLADAVSVATTDFEWCLSQWLEVFDRSQVYVDFYETVGRDPRALLRRVFSHVGVGSDVDWSLLQAEQIIHSSTDGQAPPEEIRRFLDATYGAKARSLRSFLSSTFALECPPEWDPVLAAPSPDPVMIEEYRGHRLFVGGSEFAATPPGAVEEPRYRASDVESLRFMIDSGTAVVDRGWFLDRLHHLQADRFFAGPAGVLGRTDGHWIVYSNDGFYAFDETLTDRPSEVGEHDLHLWLRQERAFTSPSLDELYAGCRETLVDESVNGCNILRFRNRFFTVRQELGPVALTSADGEWVRMQKERNMLAVADSLEGARRDAARLARLSAGGAPVSFIHHGYKHFNVLAIGDRICGLHQDLGPIAIADDNLPWKEWEASGMAVCRDSVDEVVAWIDAR
jgi:hypothetical protein